MVIIRFLVPDVSPIVVFNIASGYTGIIGGSVVVKSVGSADVVDPAGCEHRASSTCSTTMDGAIYAFLVISYKSF